MTIQQELEMLIKNEVLVEIEDYIDELFEIIASRKDDDSIKEELKNMQEMKKEWNHSWPWEWFAFKRNFYVDTNGIIH